jgi:hypothetical protein
MAIGQWYKGASRRKEQDMNKLSTIIAATITIATTIIVATGPSTIVTLGCVAAVAASYAWLLRRLHIHYNTSGM